MKKITDYQARLVKAIAALPLDEIQSLAAVLGKAWRERRQVFLCGNGGSAANAIHLANDFFYGIAKDIEGPGLCVQALSANQSITTCLANDVSYADIFSEQLKGYAQPGDVLIVLSGSGNSPNIVRAIEVAKQMKLATFAILGYSGGKALDLADMAIHVAVDDMQIAEDLQVIVGHMLMQWLTENPPGERK